MSDEYFFTDSSRHLAIDLVLKTLIFCCLSKFREGLVVSKNNWLPSTVEYDFWVILYFCLRQTSLVPLFFLKFPQLAPSSFVNFDIILVLLISFELKLLLDDEILDVPVYGILLSLGLTTHIDVFPILFFGIMCVQRDLRIYKVLLIAQLRGHKSCSALCRWATACTLHRKSRVALFPSTNLDFELVVYPLIHAFFEAPHQHTDLILWLPPEVCFLELGLLVGVNFGGLGLFIIVWHQGWIPSWTWRMTLHDIQICIVSSWCMDFWAPGWCQTSIIFFCSLVLYRQLLISSARRLRNIPLIGKYWIEVNPTIYTLKWSQIYRLSDKFNDLLLWVLASFVVSLL